jgi:hypothetical protein
MDMLVVGREATMNGESAMSSLREKKQEGEKKSEKRNFVLSSHTVYGMDKRSVGARRVQGGGGRETTLAEQPSDGGERKVKSDQHAVTRKGR